MKKRKGFYSISVVAKMFSVHQQTIRMYEKEGLITPKRSDGNTRLFSEEDVDRLEEIINLTHKMGVNLAGVEIILKLQKKMNKMQAEINKMFKQAEGEIEEETQQLKHEVRRQVGRLAQIKEENQKIAAGPRAERPRLAQSEPTRKQGGRGKESEPQDLNDDWKIEYDE